MFHWTHVQTLQNHKPIKLCAREQICPEKLLDTLVKDYDREHIETAVCSYQLWMITLPNPLRKWFSAEEMPMMTREEAKTCESRPWQCLLQHGLLPTALPVQQDKNRRQKSKGVPSGFINFTLTEEEDGTRSFPEPGISHILCGGFNMSVVVVVNSLSGYISTPKTSIILTIRKGVCPHPQKTPKDSSWSFSSSKTALGVQRA